MESQPQNPEFRINPENYHQCKCQKKTNNEACASSDISDQSEHLLSLNKVLTVHLKILWVLRYLWSAQ